MSLASSEDAVIKIKMLMALNQEIDVAEEQIFHKISLKKHNVMHDAQDSMKNSREKVPERGNLMDKLMLQKFTRRKESLFNPLGFKNGPLTSPTLVFPMMNRPIRQFEDTITMMQTPDSKNQSIQLESQKINQLNLNQKEEVSKLSMSSDGKLSIKVPLKKVRKKPIKVISSEMAQITSPVKTKPIANPSSLKASSSRKQKSSIKATEVRFAEKDKVVEVPKLNFVAPMTLDDISDDMEYRKKPIDLFTVTRPRVSLFVGGSSSLNGRCKGSTKDDKSGIEDYNDLDELLENNIGSNFLQYVTRKDADTTAVFQMLIEQRRNANDSKHARQRMIEEAKDARYQSYFINRYAYLHEKPLLNKKEDPKVKNEVEKFKFYFNQELSNQKVDNLEIAFLQNALLYNHKFNRKNRQNMQMQGLR